MLTFIVLYLFIFPHPFFLRGMYVNIVFISIVIHSPAKSRMV
jgi:hypothetical protein